MERRCPDDVAKSIVCRRLPAKSDLITYSLQGIATHRTRVFLRLSERFGYSPSPDRSTAVASYQGAACRMRFRNLRTDVFATGDLAHESESVPRLRRAERGARHAAGDLVVSQFYGRREKDRGAPAALVRDRRCRIPSFAECAARSADRRGQSDRDTGQWRADFPGDAAGDPQCEIDDHFRNLYLLVRNDRRGVRRCVERTRAGRGQGACAARLGGQHQDGAGDDRIDARGGYRSRALP